MLGRASVTHRSIRAVAEGDNVQRLIREERPAKADAPERRAHDGPPRPEIRRQGHAPYGVVRHHRHRAPGHAEPRERPPAEHEAGREGDERRRIAEEIPPPARVPSHQSPSCRVRGSNIKRSWLRMWSVEFEDSARPRRFCRRADSEGRAPSPPSSRTEYSASEASGDVLWRECIDKWTVPRAMRRPAAGW